MSLRGVQVRHPAEQPISPLQTILLQILMSKRGIKSCVEDRGAVFLRLKQIPLPTAYRGVLREVLQRGTTEGYYRRVGCLPAGSLFGVCVGLPELGVVLLLLLLEFKCTHII